MDTKQITEKIVREQDFSEARLPEAGLYGVLETGDTFKIGSGLDVYHLLSQHIFESPLKIKGLAVSTSGWAAPLANDGSVEGAPSEHAQRRRVLLVALVTAQEIMSALLFVDEDEITFDTEGHGALAEALREAFERAMAQ